MRGGFLKLLRLDKYAHRNDLHVAATVALMTAFNGLALFLKALPRHSIGTPSTLPRPFPDRS